MEAELLEASVSGEPIVITHSHIYGNKILSYCGENTTYSGSLQRVCYSSRVGSFVLCFHDIASPGMMCVLCPDSVMDTKEVSVSEATGRVSNRAGKYQ